MSQTEVQISPTISARRGTKQTCTNDDCGRRFYDLKKEPADCPYCGAAVEAHAVLRHDSKRSASDRRASHTDWTPRLRSRTLMTPRLRPKSTRTKKTRRRTRRRIY